MEINEQELYITELRRQKRPLWMSDLGIDDYADIIGGGGDIYRDRLPPAWARYMGEEFTEAEESQLGSVNLDDFSSVPKEEPSDVMGYTGYGASEPPDFYTEESASEQSMESTPQSSGAQTQSSRETKKETRTESESGSPAGLGVEANVEANVQGVPETVETATDAVKQTTKTATDTITGAVGALGGLAKGKKKKDK